MEGRGNAMEGRGKPWDWFFSTGKKDKNGNGPGRCKFCLKDYKYTDAVRIRAHIMGVKGKGISICPNPGADAIEALSPAPPQSAQAPAAMRCAAAAAAPIGIASYFQGAPAVGGSGASTSMANVRTSFFLFAC